VASLNEASLVVANGLGLEEGLADVLEAAEGDGVRVLEVAPLLDPIPFGAVTSHDSVGDGADGADSVDPHVWLDPLRMGDAARLIASDLASIAPTVNWMERADTYASELAAADGAIVGMLGSISPGNRRLVTNHDSLGYLADRYDFEIVGTVIPSGSTFANPSSEQLATLIAVMRTEDVNVVFAETTQPELLADAIAAELGEDAIVVELYTGSLGEPGSGADTLVGLLRTNALRIAGALGD
jgi:zinc/manganese transport system substrate-binding protein